MFPFTLPCSPETNFKTLYFSYPQVLLNLPRQNQSDRLCESISYIFHHPTLVAKKKTSFHKLKHIFNPTNPEIPNNSPPLPPHPPWIQDVSPINTNLPVSKQRGKIPAFTDSECFSKRCDSENSTETLGSSGEVVPPTPHRITKGGRFMWGAVEGFFVEELGGLYEKFGDGRTWYIWFDVTSIFFDWDSPTYILYISVLVPVVRSSTKNTHHDKSCLSGPPDLDPWILKPALFVAISSPHVYHPIAVYQLGRAPAVKANSRCMGSRWANGARM